MAPPDPQHVVAVDFRRGRRRQAWRFAAYNPRFRQEAIAPIQNKIGHLVPRGNQGETGASIRMRKRRRMRDARRA